MSPFGYLVLGCGLGALGFGGALVLLFGQEWVTKRGANKIREEMEGRG